MFVKKSFNTFQKTLTKLWITTLYNIMRFVCKNNTNVKTQEEKLFCVTVLKGSKKKVEGLWSTWKTCFLFSFKFSYTAF